jgi:tetratricopeptide (TPR) repeat protein
MVSRLNPWRIGILLLLIGALGLYGCDKDKKKTTPDGRRASAGNGGGSGSGGNGGGGAAREGGASAEGGEGASRPGEAPPRAADPWVRPPPPRGLPKPPPPKLMTITQIKRLVSSRQYDRALKEARKILEVNERSVPAMAVMADAYFRKGEYELCRAVLDSINLQQKEHPLYLYLQGHLFLKEKNYKLAQDFFEKAVRKNPGLLDAWTMIGVRYLMGGSYQKALTALLKAKSLSGGNTYAVNLNIGSCYRGLGHRNNNTSHLVTALNYFSEAEKKFRRVPGNTNKPYLKALYNKGILYLDAKKFPGYNKIRRLQKAIHYLQQYVTLAPRYAPKEWYKEKAEVMKILNKARNVDLPAAKAQAQAAAAAASQPRPRPGPPRPPPR